MKCFLLVHYDERFDTPDGGYDTEIRVVREIINFCSKKKALIYLQRNLCWEDTRKRMNFKTMAEYTKECRFFCYPEKYKKTVREKINVRKEYSI